ncbi:MAG: hypothetical protein J5744_02820, partial [Oscillospiraceae bacterium]|nr:hypothetical protein [Oscillospiraceae bacterium]
MIKTINDYELGQDRRKDFRLLTLAFLLFMLYGMLHQFREGWYVADSYVTTLLAFSYLRNGFVRRGLVGTLFDILCRAVPPALSYKGAVWFMWGINVLYFLSLLAFARWILGKIRDCSAYRGAFWFTIFCFVFLVPTACVGNGALGRADLIQMVFGLLQVYLLVEMKNEWLTVPLTAVNVMFHEGYIIMTFCA